jgi:hypothetical protein
MEGTRMQRLDLGSATIDPSGPVAAGSFTTLRFTYTAGHPIDDTGFLKIAFRFASDFGTPQFDAPGRPDFCTVRTTGDCRIESRWDPKGHTRPWGLSLHLKVMGGFLDSGRQIIVTFGDRSGGSPGWRLQTFCEESFEFKTLVDPIATYEFKELPHSPTLRIVPGTPERAVCIAPSAVRVGTPFAYHLKLEDRWGNPVRRPDAIVHPGFDTPGVIRFAAADADTGLAAESNPVRVQREPVAMHPVWADLHGQSEETIGTNTIDDYFRFARDYALLDACGHQGNDFQITDAFWKTINRVSRRFYAPGRFVTFPGYEWSGNTPLGGDRNVYFSSEGGRISRSGTDLLPGKASIYADSPDAVRLFKRLRRAAGPRAFGFAHVGGRYADLSIHDPEIELAAEVHSAWGTFEWLVEEALSRGYRIGICANSDDHKGRPGASHPGAGRFGAYGGLTGILVEKLDRRNVEAALRARSFYATTGHRCLLDVDILTAEGRTTVMGAVAEAGPGVPVLRVRYFGTGPVQRIEVRNGLKTIHVARPYSLREAGRRIQILWSGAEVRGRARMSVWDGSLRITGNRVTAAVPVNFRNPERPLTPRGRNGFSWTSVTTGNASGVILTLADPQHGEIRLDTVRRSVRMAVRSARVVPRVWHCGGLCKQIEIGRLPDRPPSPDLAFDLPLADLGPGDNPIYVCALQEDGHRAWSSPIYLTTGAGRGSEHDR